MPIEPDSVTEPVVAEKPGAALPLPPAARLGELEFAHTRDVVGPTSPPAPKTPAILNIAVGTTIDDAIKALTLATYKACNFDKAETARVLDISLKTLYNWLRKWEDAQETPVVWD